MVEYSFKLMQYMLDKQQRVQGNNNSPFLGTISWI